MARQGYYISTHENTRRHLSDNEWGYWYDGRAAAQNILGTDGKVIAQAGEARNGGSYETRFRHIAVWNTVMDNYEHTLMRWGELLTTEASA